MLHRHWLPLLFGIPLAACGPTATTAGLPPAETPATGPGAPSAAPAGLLVDDFEDGDGRSLLGGLWYSYDDTANGGGSKVTIAQKDGAMQMVGEGYESTHSLLADFRFERGTLPYEPFVGFGVALGAAHANLSAYEALEYTYRGGAHEVRIETTNVKEWDFHAVQLPESPAWRTVQLKLDQFRQGGWGPRVPFAVESSRAISWHVRGVSGKVGTLQVDAVRLLPPGAIAPSPPDLVIHDPEPPAPITLDSLTISHPLQAVAMKSLTRGYNITNWLEQDRFSAFTYDEAFVEKLARAGFKSLRLPIDLDRYVERWAPAGNDDGLVVHPDLFRVLDAFDGWTRARGLSLTIDYHQYDHSFDVDDPDSTRKMVALWGAVAKHFAKSPRQDLFYELLNEPELAAKSRGPTAAEWTALSERMIAAIRRHDPKRPILFGDVKWYDIDRLIERKPFADPNVIYIFHFYEPFVFTHQGASWVGMAAAHDIPYPYTRERWSDHLEDLGFSALNASWQLDQVRNYHKNGNRQALYNRVAEVKRWAVQNNVPLICNEFGVNDITARKEDIVRYYTDLIGVFDELQIPWQVWFKIMDQKTGAVDPELQRAFRLSP